MNNIVKGLCKVIPSARGVLFRAKVRVVGVLCEG